MSHDLPRRVPFSIARTSIASLAIVLGLLLDAPAVPAGALAGLSELSALSPGGLDRVSTASTACPTFSWTALPVVTELSVWRLIEGGYRIEDEPALRFEAPPGAASWTPSAEQCLEVGARYAWAVRARLGRASQGDPGDRRPLVWSQPRLFAVASPLATTGIDAATADRERDGSRPAVRRLQREQRREAAGSGDERSGFLQPVPRLDLSTVEVGLRARREGSTSVGIAGEGEGAGVVAENTASGADLVLVGPDRDADNTEFSESGILVGGTTFEIANASGDLRLELDGADVVTALTDRDTLAALACSEGQVAKLAAGDWACAADASALVDPDDFVQNHTLVQVNANFNIDGDGTLGGALSASTVSATNRFELAGIPVLGAPGNHNLLVGPGTGFALTTGSFVTFIGNQAGVAATTGYHNTFVGSFAGTDTTTGGYNSFFGTAAGLENTTGSVNTAIGSNAGRLTTTGVSNTFVGSRAGYANTTGSRNSFFGNRAGLSSTTTNGSSFFGYEAGSGASGSFNSFFGYRSGSAYGTGSSNSFFGFEAGRDNTGSLNSFFGDRAGFSNISGLRNSFFGFEAGLNSTGDWNAFFGASAGGSNTSGYANVFVGNRAGFTNSTGRSNTAIGDEADFTAANLTYATAIGAGAVVDTSDTVALGRPVDTVSVTGSLKIGTLAASIGASATLCIDTTSHLVSMCPSSLRFKTDLVPFELGMELVERLRPVTFAWRSGPGRDLGLIAEEVAAVEPLLVTHDPEGRIRGVKYEQLTVVLINALRDQQAELEATQARIGVLERRLEAERRSSP